MDPQNWFLLDPFGKTGITWYRYNGVTLQTYTELYDALRLLHIR